MNVLKWFFDNVYKIEVDFKEPRIPYRETITKASQSDYRHKNSREAPVSSVKST